MKRRLFNIAAAGSLLIALLVVIVWIRSESNQEEISWSMPPTEDYRVDVYAITWRGVIAFGRRVLYRTPGAPATYGIPRRENAWMYVSRPMVPLRSPQRYIAYPPEETWFAWSSFDDIVSAETGLSLEDKWLRVPDWFLLLMSGVLPTIWVIKYRRQQRRKLTGCCSKCGYDLRATPSAARNAGR